MLNRLVRAVLPLLGAAALLGAAPAPPAGTLSGRVVGVSDGDTLTLLTAAPSQVKVRLDQIDAPESGQPWGANAKRALSGLVYGKAVQVLPQDRDRYGRTVAAVRVNGLDVNRRMVGDGAAWAYRDYLKDRRLLTLEQDARAARRGLWALPAEQITAPWEWRAERRAAARTPKPRTSGCSKRYCREMSSCAEARTHLRQCALPHLDGDGDGTPCESLCRG